MYRLVAFDLDNTLIGPDLQFSPRVLSAIARAQAQGTIITIATGRGPTPTENYAAQLGLTTPLVCFQGGIVYDPQTRRILHDQRLDPAVVPLVADLARERGWHLQFETPRMIYLTRDEAHPAILLDLLKISPWCYVADFATDLPETPHKFILAVHTPAEREALTAELREAMASHQAPVTVVPSHPILVEGLPAGLSKATGLAWLAEYLQIPVHEVMAVGDNDNDAEMLSWAGLGVSMSNGSAAALAAADTRVPSVGDDGAAVALETFVLV